MELVGDPFVW